MLHHTGKEHYIKIINMYVNTAQNQDFGLLLNGHHVLLSNIKLKNVLLTSLLLDYLRNHQIYVENVFTHKMCLCSKYFSLQ
jgi:hypothetical protein